MIGRPLTTSTPTTATSSRQRILDLAIAALEQGGEASIRVNDIAQHAGVAVTSLYHFYGNREGLVAAAQTARYRRVTIQEFATVQVQVDACTSLQEFRLLIETWIRRFLESPDNAASRAIRVQTYASALTRPDIATLLAEDLELQSQRMFDFLEPLKVKGWIKADTDTRTFGGFYLGVMMGHVLSEVGSPNVNRENWITMTIDALMQIVPEID